MIKINGEKYNLTFKKANGKLWSRSGIVKNIGKNFERYILSSDYLDSSLCSIAIYDVPAGTKWFDSNERTNGFYINFESNEGVFYIYIVHPCLLDNEHIIQLWNTISSLHNTDYMIYFNMDSGKNVEYSMLGIPLLDGVKTIEQCYFPDEIQTIYKLHDLRVYGFCELGNVFPMCITTKGCSIEEQSYKFKESIAPQTYLYSK